MKYKNDIKTFLVITFVVVQILSMIFNSYFVNFNIGSYTLTFNYSVVFFCIGFFIVDIINDFFSTDEANKFIGYKVYSQIIFLIFSWSAINVYHLENSQFSSMVDDSFFTVIDSYISTYCGYRLMNYIMANMKNGIYKGSSIFRRYLYSTLPGEILFSMIFSILSFSKGRTIDEVLHIFTTSCFAKIILSIIFALMISFLYKLILSNKTSYIYNRIELS